MTAEEFTTWNTDLCRKFPAIAAWQRGLGDALGELLADWDDVLSRTPFSEAMQANRRILAGDEETDRGPLPGTFPSDWQTLPAHIRRIAARLRPARQDLPIDYRPSDFPAGKMLRRLQELVAGGMPHDDAVKQVAAEIPAGNPSREARYNCHLCQDSRRIFVASPSAIRAMLAGKFDVCHHRIGVMRCRCDNRQDERRPLEQFNPQLDFKVDDYAWGPAEVERFRAWVKWQRDNSAEQRAKACANYEPAFAGFAKD